MSGNIFDLSSKGKTPKKKAAPAAPAAPDITVKNTASIEDIREQIEKMKEVQASFSNQIDDLFKKSGQDRQTLSKFCENPTNFTKDQWSTMQQKKEELETTLSGLSKENLEAQKKKKAVMAASKERRGKTLGSRKNWLDMR